MKRLLVLCLLVILCAGCAEGVSAKKAHYPNAITPEAQARFDAADALYRSKRFSEADAAFEKIITDLPYTEITDESLFRRGEIAFIKKNYESALNFYRQSVSQIVSPGIAPKAEFKAAFSLFNLGRSQESLNELKKINRKDTSAVLRLRVDSLGARASKALGVVPNQSMAWNLFLLDDYTDAQGTRPSGIPADELVTEEVALKEVQRFVTDGSVTQAELEQLPLKEMRGKRSGGFASYKLALVLHSTGDTKGATRQLKAYITTYPKHEYYGAARLLMGELGGVIGEGAGISVGVLLPLSGKYAVYGESTLHGIECAVGVFEPCVGPGGMKLVIRDSESAAGAVAAIDQLAAENVVAIVGPLLSTNATEAAGRAQALGIPLISLSQRDGVAEMGDYIFRNSVSDPSEMSTLAEYAVKDLHLKKFFILHPTNKKAFEYQSLFIEAVKSLGGTIVATKPYSPNQMVEVGDELRGRGASEQKAEDEKSSAADMSAGVANYDAVFIPDSLAAANYIAEHLALSGADKFRLLGISRWDDQKFVDRAGVYINGAIFVDSFYKKAPEEQVSSFVSRFEGAYGVAPTLLEALGYDAMRMVISAVQEKGAVQRVSVRDALMRTSNFPGVSGRITFNAQGDAERKLWVLTVKNGTIEAAK